MTAAFWSAIAATFSAISAFVVMMIQRRALLEAARPELVVDGWGREYRGEGEDTYEVITIKKIWNVGKGAALHVSFQMLDQTDEPVALIPSVHIPIIGADERLEIGDNPIRLWWENAPRDKNG